MIYCGIPDKLLIKWLGNKKYIAPADEGEGISICGGVYLATGKRATFFCSADGFCNALNALTSWIIPENIKMNIVISVGRQEYQHYIMSAILKDLIDILPYDQKFINFKLINKDASTKRT
jgi:sulfopyruvate decarboxylase TPP-binding subunit